MQQLQTTLLALLILANASPHLPAQGHIQGKSPTPIQAPNPLPQVSLVAQQDFDAAEHATKPIDSLIRIERTGSTDTPLVVRFIISRSATEDQDWAPWPKSVTFRAGVSRVDMPVLIRNDKVVEGDETIKVELRPSPDYQVAGNPATVTIKDNDFWRWAKYAGKGIPKDAPPTRSPMKYLDHIGQEPAWASLDSMFEASNNSVTAGYIGKKFDGGYFQNESRSIRDSLKMEFDFIPVIGDIYLSKLRGRSRIQHDGDLVGGLGASYQIDNKGERFHRVTVTLNIELCAPGTITIRGGPQVTGKNSPTAVSTIMASKAASNKWGAAMHSMIGFTLKLEAIENND